MTISSDSKKEKKSFFSAENNSVSAWFKYCGSERKFLTAVSFGFGWDFRNDNKRPKKEFEKIIDDKLSLFEENINLLELDSYNLTLGDDAFWIANKYYGWAFKPNSRKFGYSNGEYGLTLKQIARLDNLLTNIQKKKLLS